MKKTVILMTILTILGKILAIIRESALASTWGTSYMVDAYLTAGAIGGIVFGWLLSVHYCFTPVYIDVCNRKSQGKGRKFVGNLVAIMLVVYGVLALILYLGKDILVDIIVPGYSDVAKKQTIYFFSASVTSIIIVPIVNLLKSYMEANGHFVKSLATDSFCSLLQISMILVSGYLGAKYLGYALIFPFIAQLLIIILILKAEKLSFSVHFAFTSELKKIAVLLIPICASSMLTEMNSFVDKLFASSLTSGSVAIINYATTLRDAILNVFMYAFVTISFPILSTYISQNKMFELKQSVQKSMQMVFFVFIPLCIGAIVLSRNIIVLIYGRGSFTDYDVNSTRNVFIIYAIAILPIVLRTYLLKVFYAFQDTKISIKAGILSTSVNIVLNYILVQVLGREGLAFATVLSDVIVLPVFWYGLKKKIYGLDYKRIVLSSMRSVLAGVIMGIFVNSINDILSESGKILIIERTLICTVAGVIIYVIISKLLKSEEMQEVIEILKKRSSN